MKAAVDLLLGFAVLWTALLAVSLYNFLVVNAYLICTVQLAINSALLLFVYWRYVRLKRKLPQALANVDHAVNNRMVNVTNTLKDK